MGRHTTKEAIDDCVASYKYLLNEKGFKPEQIVIWGCSGGGSATLLTGLQISSSGLPNPRSLVVGSPIGGEVLLGDVNKVFELPSVKQEIEFDSDAMLDLGTGMDLIFAEWFKNKDYVLSLLNNAKGMARTMIHFGSQELLSSIDKLTFDHLKKQNAPVEMKNLTNFGHCEVLLDTPEGKRELDNLVAWAWS